MSKSQRVKSHQETSSLYPREKSVKPLTLLKCLFYFYFISFAKKKNKQTNRKKECWQGHRNCCGQLQRAQILIKKIKKKKKLKNSAIQEKVQLHTTSYLTGQGTSTFTF